MDQNEIQQKIQRAVDENDSYSMDDLYKEIQEQNTSTNDLGPLNINFCNLSHNEDPKFNYPADSGFDLRAYLGTAKIIIEPNSTEIIPTGLYFELPENLEMQIRPRSGLAVKKGLTVLNSPGTIDSNYRGEIQVILRNHTNQKTRIEEGERIAQAVLAPVYTGNIVNLSKVEKIEENTDRGDKGFGSTGTK